jgi:hypothetical protein
VGAGHPSPAQLLNQNLEKIGIPLRFKMAENHSSAAAQMTAARGLLTGHSPINLDANQAAATKERCAAS